MQPTQHTTRRRIRRLPLFFACLGLVLLAGCVEDASRDHAATADATNASETWPGLRATGRAGRYALQLLQPSQPIVIANGAFQQWQVRLQNAVGSVVYPARISIDGGMPGHGHGLPSQPRVTEYLGDGVYLVEGLKFHMVGSWQLRFSVHAQAGSDLIELNFEVSY